MSGRRTLSLGERLEVEAALDSAFADLRARHTEVSPLRVRAAVRWGRGVEPRPPAALRWSSTVRRISELSVAVGMSVMMFGAALGPAQPEARPEPMSGAVPGIRTAGPTLDQQREMLEVKQEWIDTLRARLESFLASQIQDMLDPTVVRLTARVRTDLPEPQGTDRTHPY